jgi:hypothetical protein
MSSTKKEVTIASSAGDKNNQETSMEELKRELEAEQKSKERIAAVQDVAESPKNHIWCFCCQT